MISKFSKIGILFLLILSFTAEAAYFKPLTPSRFKFDNGMELFLLEDHELPTLQLSLLIRGGSVYDPPGKEGLAALAMQAVRLGGTRDLDPDTVEQLLESVGASLEVETKQEYSVVSLALLKKDFKTGLDILFDLLQNPSLNPARFEIARRRVKESLLRERENPMALASRKFPSLVYGEGSTWGRHPTPESVENISLEDVRTFCRQFLYPDRIILAGSGDLSVAEFKESINGRTVSWPRATQTLPEIPPIEKKFQGGLVLLSRPGLTQTTLVAGHLGEKRMSPDKFPLLVMNFILGGSGAITSRMGEEIRSREGKAYVVWSDFGFGPDYGLFRVIAQTAAENTVWVAKKMTEILHQLKIEPHFTDEETARAKQSILRSLFFDFETRFQQVAEIARFHFLGYPENYLEIFQKEIASVSRKDLERVAKQYLHPEALQMLIVGDEARLKKKLPELGEVQIRKVP